MRSTAKQCLSTLYLCALVSGPVVADDVSRAAAIANQLKTQAAAAAAEGAKADAPAQAAVKASSTAEAAAAAARAEAAASQRSAAAAKTASADAKTAADSAEKARDAAIAAAAKHDCAAAKAEAAKAAAAYEAAKAAYKAASGAKDEAANHVAQAGPSVTKADADVSAADKAARSAQNAADAASKIADAAAAVFAAAFGKSLTMSDVGKKTDDGDIPYSAATYPYEQAASGSVQDANTDAGNAQALAEEARFQANDAARAARAAAAAVGRARGAVANANVEFRVALKSASRAQDAAEAAKKAADACTPPPPPPPPPPPSRPPVGGNPPVGNPTHRASSCAPCRGLAEALNNAADAYAASRDAAALASLQALARDLDACEKQCAAAVGVVVERVNNTAGNNPLDPQNPLGALTSAVPGAPPAGACPQPQPPSETQTVSCTPPATGSIVQSRSYTCVNSAWIALPWIPISNTCSSTPPTCSGPQPPPDTQTLACPAGQVGSIVQTRTYSCVGTTWTPGPFVVTSNSCATPVAGCATNFSSGNYACSGACGIGSAGLSVSSGSNNMIANPFGSNSNVGFTCSRPSASSQIANLTILGQPGHTCTLTGMSLTSFSIFCRNNSGGTCNSSCSR